MSEFAHMSNVELRRLEADSNTSPDVWRSAVAEIARRERFGRSSPAVGHGSTSPREHGTGVTITAIDLSFWAWVRLIFTVTLASIPAMILIVAMVTIAGALFGGLVAGLSHLR